jgi:hypothetical protein
MLFGRWVYSSLFDLYNQHTAEESSILLYLLIYSTYHGQVWLNDSHSVTPMSFHLKGKMRVLARISSCAIKWGPGNDVSFVEGPR